MSDNQLSGQSAFEHEAARRNNSVVEITNISKEDFTHSYGGIPYTIKAAETLPFPYPIAMHLAKHLAMRMARAEASAKMDFKKQGDVTQAVNLYTPAKLQGFINQIVKTTVEQPLSERKTEAQIMKEKTEKIQAAAKAKGAKPAAPKPDKKDIVAELKKRGIKCDPRKESTDDLLKKLMEAEQAGNTGVGE